VTTNSKIIEGKEPIIVIQQDQTLEQIPEIPDEKEENELNSEILVYKDLSVDVPLYVTLSTIGNTGYSKFKLSFRSSEINFYQIQQQELFDGNFSDSSESKIFFNLYETRGKNIEFHQSDDLTLRQNIQPKTDAPINLIQLNIGYGDINYYTDGEPFETSNTFLPEGGLEGSNIYFIDRSVLATPFYITRTEFGDSKEDSGVIFDREIPEYMQKVMNSLKQDPFEGGGGALFIPIDPITTNWSGDAYEFKLTLNLETLFNNGNVLNDQVSGTPFDFQITFLEIEMDKYTFDLPPGQWYKREQK